MDDLKSDRVLNPTDVERLEDVVKLLDRARDVPQGRYGGMADAIEAVREQAYTRIVVIQETQE